MRVLLESLKRSPMMVGATVTKLASPVPTKALISTSTQKYCPDKDTRDQAQQLSHSGPYVCEGTECCLHCIFVTVQHVL